MSDVVHPVRAPRPWLVAGAALALQALVLLAPATLGGQAYFRRDVHLMWYAQADQYARAWHEGSRLLWNPAASFGQPLLADANNQVFYPFTPLHLVLRPWTFYTLYAFVHLWLAGAGAAFLARRLGLAWLPAWACGALWMASGPLLSLVDTWNQLAGASWMPWAIAAGLRTLSSGGARAALGWAAASSMQLLAGAPEMMLLASLGVAVLAAASCVHPTWRAVARAGGWAALSVALTVGLTACQWIPALDAARRAGRTTLPFEARTHWSVHPLHLAQLVVPVPLHRLALTPRARQALFGAPDPFLPSLYVGLVGTLLVAAALARPSRATWGLAGAGLVSAVLALGRFGGLYEAVVALVPPLQALRYPAKALLLTSLAWSLLCGLGLARLAEARRDARLAIAAGPLALGVLVVAGVFAFADGASLERILAAASLPEARRLAWRVALAAVLAGAAGLLALQARARAAAAWAALALLDLTLAHHDLNATAPIALYTHRPPALEAALDPDHGRLWTWDYLEPGESQRRLGREIPYLLARAPAGWDLRAAQALGLREALFPPTAASWGAQGSYDRDVPGLEPMPLGLLKEAFRRAPSAAERVRLLRLGAVSRVAALHEAAGEGLQMLGRYPGSFVDPVLVFAVPQPMLRAYMVGVARVHANDSEALSALLDPGFAPEREVVLASGAGGSSERFVGTSRVRERRADRVRIETEANGPGWTVLVDAWDPGWRVTVDDRPAVLERANLAFRAVAVPEGRHRVEFLYRPAAAAPSAWISGVSVLGLAFGAWITRSRAPRQGARTSQAR